MEIFSLRSISLFFVKRKLATLRRKFSFSMVIGQPIRQIFSQAAFKGYRPKRSKKTLSRSWTLFIFKFYKYGKTRCRVVQKFHPQFCGVNYRICVKLSLIKQLALLYGTLRQAQFPLKIWDFGCTFVRSFKVRSSRGPPNFNRCRPNPKPTYKETQTNEEEGETGPSISHQVHRSASL